MGSILETLNDGVVIADDSNQILFANAVFEEMTGTARSEIIGTDARQLYDRAEEFALAQAFHQKALKMGRTREESFLPTKAGGRLPVVVSVRALRWPIFRNRNERKKNSAQQTRGWKSNRERLSKIWNWRPEYSRAWHQSPSA